MPEPSGPSSARGVFAAVTFAVVVWSAIHLSVPPAPLSVKVSDPPPEGVIGREDRVPLELFRPDPPEAFPGWEAVQNAVVRVSCNGGATGGGILIGDGTRMLSAAHVFLNDDGSLNRNRAWCMAVHPGGDRVAIDGRGAKTDDFTIPAELGTHFSVAVTERDWVIVPLSRAPAGAQPLRIATEDTLALEQGARVLNIAGGQDNYETDGFLAQMCTYHGAPPTASDLVDGEVVGRLAEPGDEWRVARYDCDLGRGGSGSPVIGWHDGTPVIWGGLTDSLRGAERCPEVARTSCYSAGPLVTAMDIVE